MLAAVIALTVLAAVISALLLRALARGERTQLWTTHLRVLVPGLPEELRGWTLAFLADLHVGRMYVSEQRLLAALESLDPDCLAVGGDYASRVRRSQEAAIALLQRLGRRWPTICTLGNTEYYDKWDVYELRTRLAQAGVRLLVNERHQEHAGTATVELVGLDDPEEGHVDIEKALAGAAEHPGLRVAVAHSPRIWPELGRLGAHLLLCGHTHGGQVRLPGVEAPVMHAGISRRLAAGLFRYRGERGARGRLERLASHWQILGTPQGPITASTADGPLMYITRGIGATGPRVRLFCPPELVAIEFQPDEGSADQEAGDP